MSSDRAPPPQRRRYPPPWTIVEGRESFRIHDATGQDIGVYVHFAEGQRGQIMKRPTREEALRMARWIARSPELARERWPEGEQEP